MKKFSKLSFLLPSDLLVLLALFFSTVTIFSVSIVDAFRYIIYVSFYIVLPGATFVRMYSKRMLPLASFLAIAWVFGVVLEFFLYWVGSAVGIGGILHVLPVVAFLGILSQKKQGGGQIVCNAKSDSILHSGLMVIVAGAFAHFASVSFLHNPLPENVTGVSYYQDLLFHLGNAAEYKWQFPVASPRVLGTPMGYCFAAYVHMAAASNISGIELSTVLLRMFPLELLTVSLFMLFAVAKVVVRSNKGAILSVCMWYFITSFSGVFQLFYGYSTFKYNGSTSLYFLLDLFKNQNLFSLFLSPSYFFAIPLYLMLIMCVLEHKSIFRAKWNIGVVFVLLLVAGVTKATVLPIFIIGMPLYILIGSIVNKKLSLFALYFWGCSLLIYFAAGPFVRTLYVVDGYVQFKLFDYVLEMPYWEITLGYITRNLPLAFMSLYYVLLFVSAIVGYAPLSFLGLFSLLLNPKEVLRNKQVVLLIAIACSTYGMLLCLRHGPAQFYFWGYPAMGVHILGAYGVMKLVSVSKGNAIKVVFISGFILLGCGGLYTSAHKIIFPVVTQEYCARRYGSDQLVSVNVVEGLRWLRDHSLKSDAFAYNFIDIPYKQPEKYWYYSAFSERRVFMEGTYNTKEQLEWDYLYDRDDTKIPFLDRRDLLDSIFHRVDEEALLLLKNTYNVQYLVYDKRWGIEDIGEKYKGKLMTLYENADVEIFKVA